MTYSWKSLLDVREVFFHASCPDGTSSAMLVAHATSGLVEPPTFRSVQYGTDELENLTPKPGQLFVDITPPVKRWQEWSGLNPIVLDHHPTAKKVVDGLGGVYGGRDSSGALLAYNHVLRPLVDAGLQSNEKIESWAKFAVLASIRDTWKDEDPDWDLSRSIAYAVMSKGSKLLVEESIKNAVDFEALEESGRPLLASADRKCELIADNSRYSESKGVRAGYFNCTENIMSDAANFLLKKRKCDLAVGFFHLFQDGKDKVSVSLRSNGRNIDVSRIATALGGGGHAPAAGFRLLDEVSMKTIVETVESHLELGMIRGD